MSVYRKDKPFAPQGATPPISTMSPATVEEALECMDFGITYFHERDDFRAVFLSAYRVITQQMREAIRGRDAFFHDPEWMSHLVGTFATLYFRSLRTFETARDDELAWKVAHGLAMSKRSTVLQDVLLGVNAHIKYDLPFALETHLREAKRREILLRKQDHERADLVLTRSILPLRLSIPRRYGGSLRVFDRRFLPLDKRLASVIGPYHRGQVWADALALVDARSHEQRRAVTRKIDDASARTAEIIRRWFVPRWLGAEHSSRLRDFAPLVIANAA